MKKILLMLVAVVIAGGAYFALNLSPKVKTVIEQQASRALGVPVTLGSLTLSLADKSAHLGRLTVANPKGFSAPTLMETDEISVTIGEVSRARVTIREVTVNGLHVTYEMSETGQSNFDALQAKMKKSGTHGGKPAAASSQPAMNKSDAPRIVITRLIITNALLLPAVAGQGTTIALPQLVLTNLGTEKNPETIGQIADQILAQVLAVSGQALMNAGMKQVQEGLKQGLKYQLNKQGLSGLLGN